MAIVIIASSGSLQNRRMGNLNLQKVFLLGIPAMVTAQFGVKIANYIPEYWLLLLFRKESEKRKDRKKEGKKERRRKKRKK